MQHGEIYFGARLLADAAGEAVGLCSAEQVGDYIGDLDHLFAARAALRDPISAEAQARRPQRAAVAGDGLAVGNNADEVQNPRRHITA